MRRAVEIRSYTLRPGTRDAFDTPMRTRAVPLLRDFGFGVVACRPSPHDEDAYTLIRAWRDLDDRAASQDAFHGGAAWRKGPRAALLALLARYASTVPPLDEAANDVLRSAS